MKLSRNLTRKKIFGVPPLVIFAIILLIMSHPSNEDNEAKIELVKDLLSFTQQNEFPDCQIIDLFVPKLDGQLNNDNLFLEPSHSVRFTNASGRHERFFKGIFVDRLNIANLVEELVNTPDFGFDCYLGTGYVTGDDWMEVQDFMFTSKTLHLSFLTKEGYTLSVEFINDNGVHLDHITGFSFDGHFTIRIKPADVKIVSVVHEVHDDEKYDFVDMSLDQLITGDFSDMWGNYTQDQINGIKYFLIDTHSLADIIERLDLTAESREMYENVIKLLK